MNHFNVFPTQPFYPPQSDWYRSAVGSCCVVTGWQFLLLLNFHEMKLTAQKCVPLQRWQDSAIFFHLHVQTAKQPYFQWIRRNSSRWAVLALLCTFMKSICTYVHVYVSPVGSFCEHTHFRCPSKYTLDMLFFANSQSIVLAAEHQ